MNTLFLPVTPPRKNHCRAFAAALCLLASPLFAQTTLFQLLPASQTGISFINQIDENESLNVLAYEYFYNGGGVAVGDLNNDGLPDLFFTANLKPNKLYLNLGGLKFKDITSDAGKDLGGRSGGWKTGVSMADVNGDGFLDIYVCYSGKTDDDKRRNQLFINQGKSGSASVQFIDQAAQYGLDDPSYSTQATFFDYDRDGPGARAAAAGGGRALPAHGGDAHEQELQPLPHHVPHGAPVEQPCNSSLSQVRLGMKGSRDVPFWL